eukprot:14706063-Ditylum_brightwellii.AAC.1
MSPNAQMTRGQKQKKPPTPLRQKPMEKEKKRSTQGIVATSKKGAQKVLKEQEMRTRTRTASEKTCDMSEKEKECVVVIETEQQCSIEQTRSRSRSRQKGKQCSIEHT